jgi:hypothetical protein
MTALPLPGETAALVEQLERQIADSRRADNASGVAAWAEDRSLVTPGSIEPPD